MEISARLALAPDAGHEGARCMAAEQQLQIYSSSWRAPAQAFDAGASDALDRVKQALRSLPEESARELIHERTRLCSSNDDLLEVVERGSLKPPH